MFYVCTKENAMICLRIIVWKLMLFLKGSSTSDITHLVQICQKAKKPSKLIKISVLGDFFQKHSKRFKISTGKMGLRKYISVVMTEHSEIFHCLNDVPSTCLFVFVLVYDISTLMGY